MKCKCLICENQRMSKSIPGQWDNCEHGYLGSHILFCSLHVTAPDVLALATTLVRVLALDRPDPMLIADYGTLGLDVIRRLRAAIAKAMSEEA